VARRKQELSEKLASNPPQGWRDQVGPTPDPIPTETEASRAGQYIRKTYLMTPALIDRIKALADEERVGQNELVRYLLAFALDQVDSGRHALPAQPVQQRTLGV
jgi:hypothetical protein